MSHAFARESLAAYAIAHDENYQVAWHHRLIAQALERVERGELTRLIINMPPRHGKSKLASQFFPAWYLGRNPGRYIIAASYSKELAEDMGQAVRDLTNHPMHRAVFPGSMLRQDSKARSRFMTRERGVYFGTGIGGPITGKGAHLLLIDDPVKSRAEADSEIKRRAAKRWYGADAYTRLMPGGAIVVIQTRWHEDDLAGWLEREHAHEGWEVLSLPAIAEEDEPRRKAGEALWPEAYPLHRLERIKQALVAEEGERSWLALYQQRPRPIEGAMFKRPWFQIVDAAPVQAERVRYWDKAGTDGGGAYTAGVLIARTAEGLYYIEDVVRGQWSAHDREKTIKQTTETDAQRYGQFGVEVWIEQEPGSGGKESAENTIRNLDGYIVHAERVTGDKVTRAEPFAAQAEANNVRIVRGSWNAAFLDELTAFPLGKYKDQADAASGAYNKLAAGRALGEQLIEYYNPVDIGPDY